MGDDTLKFTAAVIASGGTARIPAIPGLKVVPYLTNATIFNLTELPARFGVIGAGPIGMTRPSAILFVCQVCCAYSWFLHENTYRGSHTRVTPQSSATSVTIVTVAF